MDENKFWVTVWSILAVAAVAIAIVVTTGIVTNRANYIDAGYVQVSAPGHADYLWQKK